MNDLDRFQPARKPAMDVGAALEVLAERRGPDQIVITNQGSAREWPKLSDHALDFHYIPSAMGGAVPLGLGLAIAQPDRDVLVISGDGSLLMNLGCLVTVAAAGARNFSLVVLDNGVYEITGSQQTAGSLARVDYAGLGRAAGWPHTAAFDQLDAWSSAAAAWKAAPGPRLAGLAVHPVREDYFLDPPCPITEQLDRFTTALR